MNARICPLTGKDIYIAYMQHILKPSKSVCLDVMAYVGPCFWTATLTKNSVKKENQRQSLLK